jgi:hypothetical protein
MSLRYRLGEQVERLADWLKYYSPPGCVVDGCGYVADSGVHEPVQGCAYCLAHPDRRGEHHEYVGPSYLSRLRGRNLSR